MPQRRPLLLILTFAFAVCCCWWCQQAQAQNQQRQQMQMQMMEQMKQLQKEFMEHPRDSEKRFHYGWFLMSSGGVGGDGSNRAIDVLQSCFDVPDTVDRSLEEVAPMKGYYASHLIGRYLQENRVYKTSNKFLKIAYDVSKNKLSPNGDVSELCVALQLASQFDYFPLSTDHADHALERIEYYMQEILEWMDRETYPDKYKKDAYLNEKWLSSTIPGVKNDPYVHCLYDLFTLSFYYRADTKKIAYQHYKLASLAWPKFNYVAKHVKKYEKKAAKVAAKRAKKQQQNHTTTGNDDDYHYQKCLDDGSPDHSKIRLGVVSATIQRGHSVSEDFGGVLQRLDRSVFNVTYINIHEKSTPANSAEFLTAHPDLDGLHHYFKDPNKETDDGAWMLDRIAIDEIENKFQFDIILFLDLTMSTFIRRIGMMRLAPVQINTHGHPVTSGHPSGVVQHFISWAEAELPLEESQKHYTEQLQLIPKGKIHQYYTPRVIQEGGEDFDSKIILRSRLDGQRFDHLTRKAYDKLPSYLKERELNDPLNKYNLYLCFQIPFKLHPEFDELVCGILQGDPNGHAILQLETASNNHPMFVERLQNAGCDMDRVHFLPYQKSHRLLNLYRTANVILDSYPAGGCTTTREALELGKAVVTWPARLLGGRWTLGLYNTIGLDEETKSALIASTKEEYIAKAIKVGTDREFRQRIEAKILDRVPNLFYRDEAVREWEKILLKVSPVKQCPATKIDDDDQDDDDDDDRNDDDGNDTGSTTASEKAAAPASDKDEL